MDALKLIAGFVRFCFYIVWIGVGICVLNYIDSAQTMQRDILSQLSANLTM